MQSVNVEPILSASIRQFNQNPRSDKGIVGGVDGDVSPPNVVNATGHLILKLKKKGFGSIEERCTVSVIFYDWLLTAAHCFFNQYGYTVSLNDSYIFIGEKNATLRVGNTNIVPYRIKKYLIHKDFNPNNVAIGNDVALILLDRGHRWRNYYSIPYIKKGLKPAPGSLVFAAGFGLIGNPSPNNPFGIKAEEQMEVMLDVQPFEECRKKMHVSFRSYLDENKLICASASKQAKRGIPDTCSGDSGGPLFQINRNIMYQYGITSFATTRLCGLPETVAFYTRVSYYHDDIFYAIVRRNFSSWSAFPE